MFDIYLKVLWIMSQYYWFVRSGFMFPHCICDVHFRIFLLLILHLGLYLWMKVLFLYLGLVLEWKCSLRWCFTTIHAIFVATLLFLLFWCLSCWWFLLMCIIVPMFLVLFQRLHNCVCVCIDLGCGRFLWFNCFLDI